MKQNGKLFMIPVPISDDGAGNFVPAFNGDVVKNLRHFIVEDAKTARRFLKFYGYSPIDAAILYLLNEHTNTGETSELIKPLLNGEDVGLMSDAGCPGIADPGAEVVALAHSKGIEVIPLVGPSSIVLSIMASGFNGQNFSFTGYLPIDKNARQKKIRELEALALKQSQAQFFIETPYRNDQLFDVLLSTLSTQTKLFVGKDITGAGQFLKTLPVAEWKKVKRPEINKVPVVFGIYK